jgi:diguanylate cyclase (GGDEF)-like protein/putative nucleotidyltransferase with HDIG domain
VISVPYLYVNFLALCFFVLMFTVFAAARKSPEIKSFITVMFGFICWTGGSILMRLQVYPGVSFWFYVSLLSLFSLAVLIYFFVCSFMHVKAFVLKILWSAGTALVLALTLMGVFLSPPTVQARPDGGVVFLYTMQWPIYIVCAFFLMIVLSIVKMLLDAVKSKGMRVPGVQSIIAGCVIVALGNMLQIIPGNTFPFDALAAIGFAGLLMVALYKKRMFRMTLLISRTVLLVISALICTMASAYFIDPIKRFFLGHFPLTDSSATSFVVVIFAIAIGVIYLVMTKVIDVIFTREEHQNRLLKNFSDVVSHTLSTGEIMDELVSVIKTEIPVEHMYVCLPDDGGFSPRHSSGALNSLNFKIANDSPILKYLSDCESYIMVNDLKRTPYYMSMWESEKELIRSLNLLCLVALRDQKDITGLVLLSAKERGGTLSYAEVNFLTALSSVASIAVKNAGLYERVYREARIDSLTNVYNYRYFSEKVSAEFELCRNDSLALLYVDLDDFKLYNQLYGSVDGDFALRAVADIITRCVGTSGSIFRYSGKVFAVVLPHYDGREATALATEIQRQIAAMNNAPDRRDRKTLTASCGICVSPYAASTPKELIENADLAVYNAKTTGKSKVVLFKGTSPALQRISERAMDIVERKKGKSESTYRTHSPTIFALTAAIDAKDRYTYNHSLNVARYASILATAAGINDEQVGIIYEAALLHDIGKISIPEHILSKKSSLTTDEFALMRNHVNNSIDIIRHLPSMDYLIPAVVGHHERWDGKGYPRGIAGEEIPITARCLAIADSFDAMTTNRPYRNVMSIEYAIRQIEDNAGSQFDPLLAHIFISLVKQGEILPYQMPAAPAAAAQQVQQAPQGVQSVQAGYSSAAALPSTKK